MDSYQPSQNYSQEYLDFKADMLPEASRYQRWCEALGNIIKLHVSPKENIKLQNYLTAAHVEVAPAQSVTLATISFLLAFLLTALLTAAVYFITQKLQLVFFVLYLIASVFLFYYVYSIPRRLANIWRLKASAQMVPAILYVVVYMKHTSNLEKAIEFASQHLDAPLALDFRKIFWDVEVGRFSSVKQSLDHYLESWSNYSPEFIESLHLIESSLFEPNEARRVQILEKSLQVILDGVYEKNAALLKRDSFAPYKPVYAWNYSPDIGSCSSSACLHITGRSHKSTAHLSHLQHHCAFRRILHDIRSASQATRRSR